MWIEIVGIVATLLILASMSFKTDSYKGDVLMRILNLIGSAVFSVYGFLLPAWSTAILNIALVLVNSYHLYLLVRNHKKETASQAKPTEEKTEEPKDTTK